MSGPPLILASGSPRRRQLLAELGVAFEVRPADVDETPLPGEAAADLVRRLAVAKAEAGLADALGAGIGPPVVVLAADTIVSLDGDVLGKPVDEADATRMLERLSGSRHEVLTGVAVAASHGTAARLEVDVVTTGIVMATWTPAEIAAYVATGEPMDKAGSYAIQAEVGDRFVTEVDGRFDNVVGLPLDVAARLLGAAGLPLTER